MGVPAPPTIPDTDLPPTYSEATTTSSPLPLPSPQIDPYTGLPLASPLTTHLRTLPARLRTTQLVRETAQATTDLDLTTLLVPHVEAFLADLAALSRGGKQKVGGTVVAELTMVPVSAVPVGSGMSGAGERRREGEVVRVARVDVAGVGKGKGEKGWRQQVVEEEEDDGSARGSGGRQAGFDEWGRFDTYGSGSGSSSSAEGGWWFTDEDMARRLAAYLRPEPNLERKTVQAAVVEKKVVEKEKSSGWGRWRLGGSSRKEAEQSPMLPSPVSPVLSSPGSGGEDDSVEMTVRADEVTFRKENDFGVWESMSGWGIVVAVRVRR
ncbi:hypothetical protein C8A05DRAFT_35530 [Staphylotrichum tortipilum]|uniref:Uncharacterized protein n=1 Tax=Staphylotrichum tortipilum TaxID=2831512 RepID=A0AAN6MH92_9PEZI|nr:hypothetical protein C8A05DRAFT_35530 [Staphylotrichum longicolle]